MVIHSLDQVEESSSSSTPPFPQAWSGQGRVLSSGERVGSTLVDLSTTTNTTTTSTGSLGGGLGPTLDQSQGFWSNNLESEPKWYHYFLMMCFPCFVGNPCSIIRRRDYLKLLTTFIFWISIIDVLSSNAFTLLRFSTFF
jgi:hypothetical protein